MTNNTHSEDALELGVLLGQQHALGLVAGRCSAAAAEYLRQMRDGKKYRALGMNWSDFCAKRLGISRPSADKVIRQLDEFGPAFFALSQVTHITPDEYRRISGSVSENALIHSGETIAISAENAPRLAAAIDELRQLAKAAPAEATPQPVPDTAARLSKAEQTLRAATQHFEALKARPLALEERIRLRAAIEEGMNRLHLVHIAIRP
jgi:hypothetical protein